MLCDPMDYTVCGIFQARILEWVAFPFSKGSSQPRDSTHISCIAGRVFATGATREAQTCKEIAKCLRSGADMVGKQLNLGAWIVPYRRLEILCTKSHLAIGCLFELS